MPMHNDLKEKRKSVDGLIDRGVEVIEVPGILLPW